MSSNKRTGETEGVPIVIDSDSSEPDTNHNVPAQESHGHGHDHDHGDQPSAKRQRTDESNPSVGVRVGVRFPNSHGNQHVVPHQTDSKPSALVANSTYDQEVWPLSVRDPSTSVKPGLTSAVPSGQSSNQHQDPPRLDPCESVLANIKPSHRDQFPQSPKKPIIALSGNDTNPQPHAVRATTTTTTAAPAPGANRSMQSVAQIVGSKVLATIPPGRNPSLVASSDAANSHVTEAGAPTSVVSKMGSFTQIPNSGAAAKSTVNHTSSRSADTEARKSSSNLPASNSKASPPHVGSVTSSSHALNGSHHQSGASKAESDQSEVVSNYVTLKDIPMGHLPLAPLSSLELSDLQLALQMDKSDSDSWWHEDWCGNLLLISSREVSNPILRRPKSSKSELVRALWEWGDIQGEAGKQNRRLIRNHFRHIYNMVETPPTAKRIIARLCQNFPPPERVFEIMDAVKRITYDPAVLREDGWTTGRSSVPQGASGGPFHIGTKIWWQQWEAVVIAYIHDHDMGDLWKAMFLDGLETFDLEAGELSNAIKKFEKKVNRSQKAPAPAPQPSSGGSSRFAAATNFSVEGIEHGIILAQTYNPNARPGVFWPARVMHASELENSLHQGKRHSSKGKVNVVFLAPYWNYTHASGGRNWSIQYSKCPLLEMDYIEVSQDTIQAFPYEGGKGLDMHQLRGRFKFTGLPRQAFRRYVDGYRLALALKYYAQNELTPTTSINAANAAFFDTHALAVRTAKFPHAVLHLPFDHLLAKLPVPKSDESNATTTESDEGIEPSVQLVHVMKAMEPPYCWGQTPSGETISASARNGTKPKLSLTVASPKVAVPLKDAEIRNGRVAAEPANFTSKILEENLEELEKTEATSSILKSELSRLVLRVVKLLPMVVDMENDETKRSRLLSILQECIRCKTNGEDFLQSDFKYLGKEQGEVVLAEWRKCCERLFRFVVTTCSSEGFGQKTTVVLCDNRCNEHITGHSCVERRVRLPAALKGAKLAGAGGSHEFQLMTSIDERYFSLSEKVVEYAHTTSYIRKMKSRCLALSNDTTGAPLTEDSDGEGGHDTTGSRGTFKAALAGVATALKAADMIVGGQCLNVFCATRPPGHHAGKSLHSMNAVSNGFCILNPVACAAVYATLPLSEGGLGLKRVCVIDFDVHHGNGTQDILCSTYDPRFLYVSLHAGGANINGHEGSDEDDDFQSVVSKNQEGIFPGRCGDSSPHSGVLNLPLGAHVTPHAVGNAMLSSVEPKVMGFCPDLIILSAGFDAHKNDPLGLGGLSSEHFRHITEVVCALAFKCCSGRIMSVLEGGYGVPCCRPQTDIFLPPSTSASRSSQKMTDGRGQHSATSTEFGSHPGNNNTTAGGVMRSGGGTVTGTNSAKRVQPTTLLDLDLPDDMDDQVTPGLQKKLERCHQDGFIHCVKEHVSAFRKFNAYTG